jgi:hypothetical protein
MLFMQTLPSTSAQQAAQDLLDLAITAAQSNRSYWSTLWNDLFESGLWSGLEFVAGGIAVFCAMFWGAFYLRGLLQDDITPAMSDLVWPMLVIFFIFHKPNTQSNLVKFLNAARTVPYTIVDQISLNASKKGDGNLNLQNTIRLAGYRIAMEQMVRSLYNQCAALPQASFQTCLADHAAEANAIVSNLDSVAPGTFQAEANEISQVFSGQIDPYTKTVWSNQVFVRDGIKDVLIAVLLSWQKNTLPMVEYALMSCVTMAPLCLGASMLPFGTRPIVGWLSSFVAICTAFVTYYILAALSAHNYLYNPGGFDSTAFMLKSSLIDPALGAIIGAASGRSFLSNAGASLLGSASGYGVGFLGYRKP